MARRICGVEEYPGPLLAVAGYRLPGAARAFPSAPLGERAWADLLTGARRNRVSGLLAAAVADGTLPTTTEQAASARSVYRQGQLRVMALDGQLITVVSILHGAGIECRALKGSAVARLDYAEPALRGYVDVDVMVRSRDIDAAVAALAGAGFQRTLAQPRPGFDRRFDKGMTLMRPGGFELDLHRTFVLGPWGIVMDLDQLWEQHTEFRLGSRTVAALSRPFRFLHACYHAALGDWPLRLGSLRDVAEIQRRLGDDVAAVRRIAARWGVEAVVAAAVADSHRLLGLPDDDLSSWAASFVPSRRDESWLALHTHEGKTFAAQAVATLRVLPRWRDKAAYLRALVAPDAQYTEGRHSSALRRFGYAVREVRTGLRPRR
jgi:hypothetical protein